jgi:hypothetical protein
VHGAGRHGSVLWSFAERLPNEVVGFREHAGSFRKPLNVHSSWGVGDHGSQGVDHGLLAFGEQLHQGLTIRMKLNHRPRIVHGLTGFTRHVEFARPFGRAPNVAALGFCYWTNNSHWFSPVLDFHRP